MCRDWLIMAALQAQIIYSTFANPPAALLVVFIIRTLKGRLRTTVNFINNSCNKAY